MQATDQSETIRFLSAPATFGAREVERVETHASIVFLAGQRAYKLKRAVRYDYLDFSTVEKRRAMCVAELSLNQRAAPSIYRRVVAVTRQSDGQLALEGPGPAVDWLIEMARFDQGQLLDRLAADGRLDLDVMPPLADAVARFHAGAKRRPDQGGFAGIRWVIDGNAGSFAAEAADVLDPAVAARVTAAARTSADRHRERLERRRRDGRVRECHGDLHLRNIVLLDGRPTLFDAVEFNEAISCIDVLYDTAFLLMDLWQRGLRRHASTLLNAALALDDDLDGLPLLPLFLACRAAVRAKTGATAARLAPEPARRRALEDTARRYLDLADRLIAPPPPALVAIGGLSGTGKSTLARALAWAVGPAPGAVIVRSDEVRKQLLGVAPETRLDASGYTPDVSRRVYARVRERARLILDAGHGVVVDAVFADQEERTALAGTAAAAGVAMQGIWLEAPVAVLEPRVAARRGDASDADVAVLRAQASRDPGPLEWRRIDASGAPEVVAAAAASVLDAARLDGGGARATAGDRSTR